MGISKRELSQNEVLDKVDLLIAMAPNDSYVIYMDEQGYVKKLQETRRFPFTLKIGDYIEAEHIKNTNTARCFHEKKYLEANGNPATFGFNYTSKSSPLLYDGEFKGVISVVYPADNTKLLEEGIQNLSDQVGVLNGLGQQMADAGQDQAKNAEEVLQLIADLQNHANVLENINSLIAEVATQTNLLGLNAAIESARAGEQGRGFGVVADEIRRLSLTVKDSAKQVNSKIQDIMTAIDRIDNRMQTTAANNEEMSAQLQELAASVGQIHQTSVQLSKLK